MCRSLLRAALALGLSVGCSSPQHAAIVTANGMKHATLAAHEILDSECVAMVPKAKTAEDLAALEYVCSPLSDAYRASRLAHAVLVAAIAAGESTDPASLTLRTLAAARAAARLADALDRARKPR